MMLDNLVQVEEWYVVRGLHPLLQGKKLNENDFCSKHSYLNYVKFFKLLEELTRGIGKDITGLELQYSILIHEHRGYRVIIQGLRHMTMENDYDDSHVLIKFPEGCYGFGPGGTFPVRDRKVWVGFPIEPEDYIDNLAFKTVRLHGSLVVNVLSKPSEIDMSYAVLSSEGRKILSEYFGTEVKEIEDARRLLMKDDNAFDNIVDKFSREQIVNVDEYAIKFYATKVGANDYWARNPSFEISHPRLGVRRVRLEGRLKFNFDLIP